jgi:hypothetical protein
MTDALGHGPHPDLEALADLHAQGPEATESTRAHVAGCAHCAAELAALDRVPTMLSAAGAVGPMPIEVVTAVDAALAAEAGAAEVAVAPGEAGGATEATASRTVTPLPTAHDRSPVGMRLLQAAAVVVLLLAGLGIGVSAIGGGGDSDGGGQTNADSGSAGQAASGAYPLTASGRDWTADAIAKDAPRLLAGTLSPPVAGKSLREQSSARDDTGGGSGGGAEPEAVTPAPAAADPAARLAGGPALAECVGALVGGPVTPLAVDIATWQQQPAAVIVLPAPDEPSRAEVWVVEPNCSTADAKLLYYASLPR